MSETLSSRRRSWMPFVAAGSVVLLAAGALTIRAGGPKTELHVPQPARTALPAGTWGRVGDVQVTTEAMQLAEIRIAPAGRRVVSEKLLVTGSIEAGGDRTASVTPRVPGRVVTLSAVPGDAVRVGQILATVESVELARAQADYEHARIGLRLAQTNLTRQKKLASMGAFSAPPVEAARRELAAAEGEVSAAEKDSSVARSEIGRARSEKVALEGEVTGFEADAAGAEREAATAATRVASAGGTVKIRQAAVVQAQSAAKLALSRFARYDRLLKEEIVSRQDWEQAQADARKAEAEVEAARAQVEQAETEVAGTRSELQAAQAKVAAAQAKIHSARERVKQAAVEIETAQARAAQAEGRTVSAQRRAEIARAALAREERVLQGGFAAGKEVALAESHAQEATHELEHAAGAVRLLGGSPGGGDVITLSSPIAGRVQERNASLGQMVDPEHPVFTVMNTDLVWAQLGVAPTDLHLLRTGQTVQLTTESAPGRAFTGRVSAIAATADPVTHAVQVRCALGAGDGVLKPGTFVRGSIVTDVRRDRVSVPEGALQEHEGKPTLYVAVSGEPGGFEVRHVNLGMRGDGWREVASGLKIGERVAVSGTFYLKSEALKDSLSDGCCAVPKKE